ncbi:MAG: type II toxin-antitoxin system prevent-host-death family antitoxin [Acidobacteriaceae bacterium]|nr:type II toxin-antitoxin system prevent-host-death family antitoxin [Acidobacteriaceae bacterium]
MAKKAAVASYNLYEAKTALSRLVEEAAGGKEIVIAKAGKPMAKLVPIISTPELKKRRDWGENQLGVTYVAPDFEEPVWTDDELEEMGL